MKAFTKKKSKNILCVLISILFCIAAAIGGLMLYAKMQISKIPALSFREALVYTTHDNPDAVITVGFIKDGAASYTVYGSDGEELPNELHTYEIGSLTKTFTAALIQKAVLDGKISIDDTLDRYLELPAGNNYPTIRELLTHTSGYRGYYLEKPMIQNHLQGKNDFYGVTKAMILDRVRKLDMSQEEYDFCYSNFGYAVLGLVLEVVYETDYTSLLNDFAANELGLANTHISDQTGDLGNNWDWQAQDAYIPAGAITSDMQDMLRYAEMQLDGDEPFSSCHESIRTIHASSQDYQTMGIYMDEIGMAWIIDNENGIVWHNGGTGNYNSYLGFDKENGTAVVILSNLPPDYRIPATVLGMKLMEETRRND